MKKNNNNNTKVEVIKNVEILQDVQIINKSTEFESRIESVENNDIKLKYVEEIIRKVSKGRGITINIFL